MEKRATSSHTEPRIVETHTMMGHKWNDHHIRHPGLCLDAARYLFTMFEMVQTRFAMDPETRGCEDDLVVGVSIYRVRGKTAYDLLNDDITVGGRINWTSPSVTCCVLLQDIYYNV